MNPTLEVDDLTVTAGASRPVDGVSFRLEPGRALTLIGESGSGKSLLAQAILGTLAPSLNVSGRVAVLGHASDASNARARRALWGSTIALLPQEPWLALDPTMRVGRQVGETYALVARVARQDAIARTQVDLESAGVLGARNPWPHTLSGGMAQRVAFSISRAGGAPILIVDEPTKGLDSPLRDALVARLRTMLEQGGSVLTITHDVHVARALGGDVAVLLDGRLVERGAAATVLSAPTHEYTRRLLAAAPESWPVHPAALSTGAVLVSLRQVTKRFGPRTVLSNIDLDVRAGERVIFSGPSGSGKSTLGNVVLGLLKPDGGTVTRASSVHPRGFQKLYQDPVAAFPARSTVGQSLDDLLALHRLPGSELDRLLAHLRLDRSVLARRPSEVSGGELQRLALARVLVLKPALIFADEPTSRLDPISQQISLDLLLQSVAEAGSALILVTHDAEIARAVNGRTIVLRPPVESAQAEIRSASSG